MAFKAILVAFSAAKRITDAQSFLFMFPAAAMQHDHVVLVAIAWISKCNLYQQQQLSYTRNFLLRLWQYTYQLVLLGSIEDLSKFAKIVTASSQALRLHQDMPVKEPQPVRTGWYQS
jgi:hypothetical protein